MAPNAPLPAVGALLADTAADDLLERRQRSLLRRLLDWLPRLRPGGRAHLVVQKHLGSDSLARWLDGQGFPTTRVASRAGYRILEVAARMTP